MNKTKWIKNLKVGDTVCDCSFRHLKIKAMVECFSVNFPTWLLEIVFADWMPYIIGNAFDTVFCWVSRKVGNVHLVDKDLVLEDGSQCSAGACCDPADHEWKH